MAGSVRGPQGLVGPRGDRGPQGFTGATGAPGTPGAQGRQGPIGKTGARGERGPAAPAGTGSGGGTAAIEHDVVPNDVGGTGIPGSSLKAAAANHVHKGVHSIRSNTDPQLFGDISFAEGAGVTMVQVGNTITISSTGSAPSGPAGGDLDGFYPDPLVSAVHSGATRLTFGASADGQYIKRSALAFVGVSTIPYSDITGGPSVNAITDLTGDVTATGPGSVAATIANNAVTNAKFRQSVGTSVVGRGTNSTGDVADIVASGAYQFLGTDAAGTTLAFSSIGFSALPSQSVADVAALEALTGSLYPDGSRVFVQSLGFDFVMRTVSTATVDDITVASVSGASGSRWLRSEYGKRTWWETTTWYINPTLGSDQAAGTAAGAGALKTAAEWFRRTQGRNATGTITVNIEGDLPNADVVQVDLSPSAITGTVAFVGFPTVVASGTVASAIAPNWTVNTQFNQVTITGFDWSPYVGKIVRLQGTSGASGTYQHVLADLGTGTAALGTRTVNGAFVNTGFAASDVIEVLSYPRIPGAILRNGASVVSFADLLIAPTTGTTSLRSGSGDFGIFSVTRCEIGNAVAFTNLERASLVNVTVRGTGVGLLPGTTTSRVSFVNGNIVSTSANETYTIGSAILWGSRLQIATGTTVTFAATAQDGMGVFGLATGQMGIAASGNASLQFNGYLFGSNNHAASYILNLARGVHLINAGSAGFGTNYFFSDAGTLGAVVNSGNPSAALGEVVSATGLDEVFGQQSRVGRGPTVTAASSLDVRGIGTFHQFPVTGTTTINHIQQVSAGFSQAFIPDGIEITLTFASAVTLNHLAASPPTGYAYISLATGANSMMPAGSEIKLRFAKNYFGAGFWVEVSRTPALAYPLTALADTWYIDPVNGSDLAAGTTSATAIATIAELKRRWWGAEIRQNTTVNVLGDIPASDSHAFNTRIQLGCQVTFIGSLGATTGFGGAAIDNTLYTGSVTAYTAGSATPAADDVQLTDSAIPVSFTASGLLADGVIFRRTVTATRHWYAVKDLGSKTIRITVPMNNGGAATFATNPLTVGNAYSAFHMWTMPPQSFGFTDAIGVRMDTLTAIDSSAPAPDEEGGPRGYAPIRSRIYFGTRTSRFMTQALGHTNCLHKTGGDTAFSFATQIPPGIIGGGFIGTGATKYAFFGQGGIGGACVFQGARIEINDWSYFTIEAAVAFHDNTSAAITTIGNGRVAFMQNGMSGKDNTSKLVSVSWGGSLYYGQSITATPPFVAASTSDSTPITIGSTSYTIAQLPAVLDTVLTPNTDFPSSVYETGALAELTFAAVPDGSFVQRSGTTLIGTTPIPGTSVGLTATYVGFGSVTNTLTGSSSLVYDSSAERMTVNRTFVGGIGVPLILNNTDTGTTSGIGIGFNSGGTRHATLSTTNAVSGNFFALSGVGTTQTPVIVALTDVDTFVARPNSQLATTTPTGFLWLPELQGPPSVAPTNTLGTYSRATILDEPNRRHYAYLGGAWHYASFDDGNGAAAITALTGDGTATGPGSVPLTLATVNSNVGTFAYAQVTVNGKGLITAASAGATPALASLTLTAGAGMTGGGDLSANRTFDVVAGDATIVVNANDIVAGVMQTANIATDAVTYARIQNVSAASRLLGRGSAGGAGDVEEITLGTGLSLTGTVLSSTATGVSDGDYGDITVSSSGTVWTIDNDVVTNAKAANMATATFKARITALTGDPEDITGTQATTMLDVFTSGLKGLAPASGGGSSNYLRADGTWAAPSGTGAPSSATYITQTPDGGLSAEQALSTLGTGVMSSTTTTGVVATTTFSAGAIPFGASSILSQDATNFVWDNTNKRLGIGTASPAYALDIAFNLNAFQGFRITNSNAGSSAQVQNQLANSSGNLAYFGVSSAAFTGFAPLDGGQAFFGSYGHPVSVFTQTAHDIIFYPNMVEKMRIASGGNVTITSLAGSGTRFVTATAAGLLGTDSTSYVPTTRTISTTTPLTGGGDLSTNRTIALSLPTGHRMLAGNNGGTDFESSDEIRMDGDQIDISNDGGFAWRNLGGGAMVGATNYDQIRGFLNSNTWYLKSEKAGTGVIRDMEIDADTANLSLHGANVRLKAGTTFAHYSVDGAVNFERVKAAFGSHSLASGTSWVVQVEQGGTGVQPNIVLDALGKGAIMVGTFAEIVGLASSNVLTFAASAAAGVEQNIIGSNIIRTASSGMVLDALQINTALALNGSATVSTATGVNAIHIHRPVYDGVTGTQNVNVAASLYIQNSPIGTGGCTVGSAYSLWVDAGLVRFDGDGSAIMEFPSDGTGNTSAAVGRIPISITGVGIRYLRYYTD